MEGMGLKFIPVIRRRLLRQLSMFGPMAGTSAPGFKGKMILNRLTSHIANTIAAIFK